MSKIVLFYHPGAEAPESQIVSGFKNWNTGRHCRNFIKSHGEYVDAGGQKHSGDLVFWGEWEPKARVVQTYGKGQSPRRLIEPVACSAPSAACPGGCAIGGCCQNTDPFVFGAHFRYSNCKQKRYSTLRKLNAGDIVLFGSGSKSRDFFLDTVFVVDEGKIPFSKASDLSKIPDFAVYNHYVLSCTGLPVQSPYVYYPGKKFNSQDPDDPYSFTPAKLYTQCTPFSKLKLPKNWMKNVIDKNFNGRQTQGIKVVTNVAAGSVPNVWREIRDYVLNQGRELGVQFDLPLPSTGTLGNSNSNSQGVQNEDC